MRIPSIIANSQDTIELWKGTGVNKEIIEAVCLGKWVLNPIAEIINLLKLENSLDYKQTEERDLNVLNLHSNQGQVNQDKLLYLYCLCLC